MRWFTAVPRHVGSRPKTLVACCVGVFAVVGARPSAAQTGSGVLRGVVVDSADGALL